MRPPRTITWLALVVSVPHLIGCYTFKPYAGDFPGSPEDLDHPATRERFAVVTEQGFIVELAGVWVQEQTIRGSLKTNHTSWELPDPFKVYGADLSDPTVVAIPLVEVREIEKREINPYGVVLVVVVVGALVGFVIYAIQDLNDWGEGWDLLQTLTPGVEGPSAHAAAGPA